MWVLLPTYQEAENLAPLVEAVLRELRAVAGAYRVLVIDDASPDGTGRIADELAARHPEVEVLHRPARAGLGPAYLAGFRRALAAGAGCVVQMDADFSHDPADLGPLLAASAGAHVVLGSRYVPGGTVRDWSSGRRLLSRAGGWYARRVLGVGVRDLTGGMKCLRREVLEAIGLDAVRSRGYAFQVEVTYRALREGFRVVEVPIAFTERRAGRSKMSARIALEAAFRVPALRLRGR